MSTGPAPLDGVAAPGTADRAPHRDRAAGAGERDR
jgi:hypothetical protein